MGYEYFHGFFMINKYWKMHDIYIMCSLFANLYMLLTWGPHTVCHGDPISISYLYSQNLMWLVWSIRYPQVNSLSVG